MATNRLTSHEAAAGGDTYNLVRDQRQRHGHDGRRGGPVGCRLARGWNRGSAGEIRVVVRLGGQLRGRAERGYDERRDVNGQGFVAVERHGRQGAAIRVPGLAALNKGRGVTEVLTLSCTRAGNRAAGGYYFDRPGSYTWFVVIEHDGRWGTAIQVPGLRALNKGTGGLDPSVNDFSVSCAPAGTCAAGGIYTDASGGGQGFVTQAG